MLGMDKKSSRNGTNTVETLIGSRVTIRGDIEFSGGLYVEGNIIGKITAVEAGSAVMTVAEQGHIQGEVHSPVVIIAGSLTGDVYASDTVKLEPTAKVSGNIYYKVVEMAAGAMLTGRLIHADASLSQQAASPQMVGEAEKV
jgi:cytoskeletal protein CcmA (bactofilin family)